MEEKPFLADEKLEAVINRLRKEVPHIKCPSGNTITKLCTGSKCESALRCASKECKDCGKIVHKACASIDFQDLTDIINERTQGCRQFLIKIFEIEQEFILAIRKSQKEFIDKFGTGLFQVQQTKILKNIYESGQYRVISGKDINDICQSLQMERENISAMDQQIIDRYSQKLNKLIKDFEVLKIECFKPPSKLLQIDSAILRTKGVIQKDTKYLKEILGNPKKITLLFRGTEHAFSAAKFHEKCDNIEDTLVLVRSTVGKTFGGFTHYTWNKDKGYFSDKQRKAFLFQLDLYEKMIPVSDGPLIYGRGDLGPWFGNGNPDLGFYDNIQGYCKFPSVYNKEGPSKYSENQNSYTALTGVSSGWSFQLSEYEVYRVIFQ